MLQILEVNRRENVANCPRVINYCHAGFFSQAVDLHSFFAEPDPVFFLSMRIRIQFSKITA